MREVLDLIVGYHGNCIDGFASAWAIHQAYPSSKINFVPLFHKHGDEWVDFPDVENHEVVIVDFCPPREQLIALRSKALLVDVLDHHVTAQATCEGLPHCVFDMDRSGAGLAWDIYSDLPRPWVIDYVEDHDLRHHQLPNAREIHAYIATQEMTMANWDRFSQEDLDTAIDAGKGALAYIDHYVRNMVRQARMIEFAGHPCVPVVNAPYLATSELVSKLAEMSEFAVGWFQRADGKFQYSLRSRGGFNVSELAKLHGGGGHFDAAGFTSDSPIHEL